VNWVAGEELEHEAWHADWEGDDESREVELDSELPEEIDSMIEVADAEEADADAFHEQDPFAEEDEEGEEEEVPVEATDLPTKVRVASDARPEEDMRATVVAGEAGEEIDDEDALDKRRGRRRSKTIARKQMLRERRRMLAQGTIPEIIDYERPMHRADCRDAQRPCLFVSCRYHLYLDVNPITGSIKLNFPDKEVWELAETCALDVAERGGITLEEVGEIMNLTRERIRQVEVSGLEKLKQGDVKLHTFIDGRELQLDTLPPSRLPVIDD
jgi:hypothetical protein